MESDLAMQSWNSPGACSEILAEGLSVAKLGKTSESVLRVIAKLKESHLHEVNAELGFGTRSSLRSLIGCDLIEVVRTVTRKSTKGHLVEINVYGVTDKGTQKLHLIDNPPAHIEKSTAPTAVAKAAWFKNRVFSEHFV